MTQFAAILALYETRKPYASGCIGPFGAGLAERGTNPFGLNGNHRLPCPLTIRRGIVNEAPFIYRKG